MPESVDTRKVGALSEWLAKMSATSFGIGFIKCAPGTFGSLPGLGLAYLIWSLNQHRGYSQPLVNSLVILGLYLIGFWAIRITERTFKTHDDKRIVIDEVLGQFITVCCFPPSLAAYGVGFLLFRFFDILKPFPISYLDRRVQGPTGTMIDDVAAAFAALLTMFAIDGWLYSFS